MLTTGEGIAVAGCAASLAYLLRYVIEAMSRRRIANQAGALLHAILAAITETK
jgi:predicted PurR-regulated permease PerM